MNSKTYDRLKFTALVVLPGLSTLYFAVAQIWGLPYAEQVVGSAAALDTFLGLILRKSSKDYHEQTPVPDAEFMGHLTIMQDVDGQPMQIRVDPKDDYPIFTEGKAVQFMVRRAPMFPPSPRTK